MRSLSKLLFLLVTILSIQLGYAQILQPVKWKFESEKTGENTYTIKCIASIEHGWFVYSQFLKEGGPIPTSFHFNENKDIQFAYYIYRRRYSIFRIKK